MRIIELKSQNVKILYKPTADMLKIGDFVSFKENELTIVAQVMKINSAEMTDDYNQAELNFVLSHKYGKTTTWSGEYVSAEAKLERTPKEFIEEYINKSNKDITFSLGYFSDAKNNPLKFNVKHFTTPAIVGYEKQSENATFMNIIANKLSDFGQKVLIIDYKGTCSIEGAKKVIAGFEYKLPLNSALLENLAEKMVNDISADSRAVIQEILVELSAYASESVLGFIPLQQLIKVIDETYKKSKIAQLILFKNKLRKYQRQNIFADKASEITLLENAFTENNVVIFDLSNVPFEWQSEFLNKALYAESPTMSGMYLYMPMDERNVEKEVSNYLLFKAQKNGIRPILSANYKYVELDTMLDFCENAFLFGTLNAFNKRQTLSEIIQILPENCVATVGKLTSDLIITSYLDYIPEAFRPDEIDSQEEKSVNEALDVIQNGIDVRALAKQNPPVVGIDMSAINAAFDEYPYNPTAYDIEQGEDIFANEPEFNDDNLDDKEVIAPQQPIQEQPQETPAEKQQTEELPKQRSRIILPEAEPIVDVQSVEESEPDTKKIELIPEEAIIQEEPAAVSEPVTESLEPVQEEILAEEPVQDAPAAEAETEAEAAPKMILPGTEALPQISEPEIENDDGDISLENIAAAQEAAKAAQEKMAMKAAKSASKDADQEVQKPRKMILPGTEALPKISDPEIIDEDISDVGSEIPAEENISEPIVPQNEEVELLEDAPAEELGIQDENFELNNEPEALEEYTEIESEPAQELQEVAIEEELPIEEVEEVNEPEALEEYTEVEPEPAQESQEVAPDEELQIEEVEEVSEPEEKEEVLQDMDIDEAIDGTDANMEDISADELDFLDDIATENIPAEEATQTGNDEDELLDLLNEAEDIPEVQPVSQSENIDLNDIDFDEIEDAAPPKEVPPQRKLPVYKANYNNNEQAKPAITLNKGDLVKHKKYGLGTVTESTAHGNKVLYHINFEDFGRRLLDPEISQLQKIE